MCVVHIQTGRQSIHIHTIKKLCVLMAVEIKVLDLLGAAVKGVCELSDVGSGN